MGRYITEHQAKVEHIHNFYAKKKLNTDRRTFRTDFYTDEVSLVLLRNPEKDRPANTKVENEQKMYNRTQHNI